jgi:XTP/dITP diphosphohydrolase
LKNRLKDLKKVKSLLVATNNKGKLLEIKKLLPNTINFYSPEDFKLAEPVESGKTFEANAIIKARYCAERSKLISLSDDSGLEVLALKGRPGIYSARWAGKSKNFDTAIKKVFLELKKKKKLNKSNKARFYCSLAIAWPDGKCKTFSGTVNGKISLISKGKKGFGYDPIFIAQGYKKTFGEISPDLKDKISHRYKAFSKIKRFFRYAK